VFAGSKPWDKARIMVVNHGRPARAVAVDPLETEDDDEVHPLGRLEVPLLYAGQEHHVELIGELGVGNVERVTRWNDARRRRQSMDV
jgi:hypothetical protein